MLSQGYCSCFRPISQQNCSILFFLSIRTLHIEQNQKSCYSGTRVWNTFLSSLSLSHHQFLRSLWSNYMMLAYMQVIVPGSSSTDICFPTLEKIVACRSWCGRQRQTKKCYSRLPGHRLGGAAITLGLAGQWFIGLNNDRTHFLGVWWGKQPKTHYKEESRKCFKLGHFLINNPHWNLHLNREIILT